MKLPLTLLAVMLLGACTKTPEEPARGPAVQAAMPAPPTQDKILELIYPERKTVDGQRVWEPSKDETKGLEDSESDSLLDSQLVTQVVQVIPVIQGNQFKLLALTSAATEACHACSALAGIALLTYRDGAWRVQLQNRAAKVMGSWGRVPAGRLLEIGPERYGVLIEHTDGNQGEFSTRPTLLGQTETGLGSLLPPELAEIGAENSGSGNCSDSEDDRTFDSKVNPQVCYSYSSSFSTDAEEGSAYYELRLETHGTRLEKDNSDKVVRVDALRIFRFGNGHYQEVKRKIGRR